MTRFVLLSLLEPGDDSVDPSAPPRFGSGTICSIGLAMQTERSESTLSSSNFCSNFPDVFTDDLVTKGLRRGVFLYVWLVLFYAVLETFIAVIFVSFLADRGKFLAKLQLCWLVSVWLF